MFTISKEQLERIRYRLKNAESLEGAMFPGSFATYYLQDVSALCDEIDGLKGMLAESEDQINSMGVSDKIQ